MSRNQPIRRPSFAARKPTIDELLSSGAQLNRTSTDFLKVDLETSLTFSALALQYKDNPEKRERNQANARRGYDTILRLAKKVVLDQQDARFISRHLRRLKSELQQLGETF
jgi:hypothetical protein